MIDTIKFLIPINDQTFLEKIKSKFTRTRREDLPTEKIEYEYFTSEIEVGSYKRIIKIYLKEGKPQGFFIEFSLPKQKYNNNVEMIYIDDVLKILTEFRTELCEYFKIANFPLLSSWIIYRLDLCYNWTFDSKEQCQSLMNFIQRIDFPRKKKYVYDTSVMYKGSAYSIKFYLKGTEFLKHDFKILKGLPDSKVSELLEWANKIIRFEVEFRKSYLKTLFNTDKVYIKEILVDSEIENILKYYLAKTFKYIERKNIKRENVRELINQNFRSAKALRLYQFYKGYYYEKDEKYHIMKGLNPSTIWRYKKDLKSIGVSFNENLNKGDIIKMEELEIPSKRAKFTLLDYKSSEYYN
ncbi:hypothetical protein KJ603_01630 [Patescibacteria group bacterium]|nr:hypothetical protein [Patescibacteria group bacterium]